MAAPFRRKHVVKTQPVKRATKAHDVSGLAGGIHWHVCSDTACRLVYLDSCVTPQSNGRCRVCTHSDLTPFMEWRLPRDCCIGNCELLAPGDDWLEWGRLAGPGPWFQCRTCKRAHGTALA